MSYFTLVINLRDLRRIKDSLVSCCPLISFLTSILTEAACSQFSKSGCVCPGFIAALKARKRVLNAVILLPPSRHNLLYQFSSVLAFVRWMRKVLT